MELAFETKRLRELCENETEAEHEFDLLVAKRLKKRLADMRAAKTIHDLLVGNVRSIDTMDLCKVIDLHGGYQMVFCANHLKNPKTADQKVDWQRVNRIKVMDIRP